MMPKDTIHKYFFAKFLCVDTTLSDHLSEEPFYAWMINRSEWSGWSIKKRNIPLKMVRYKEWTENE